MKRALISSILAAAAALMCATSASAYTLDAFIKSASLASSGDAVERAFAEQYASSILVMDAKADVTAANVLANPGATNQHYIDVAPDQPGFFLLKFGTGGTGVTGNTYFFQNIGELTKLVWSDAQVSDLTANFAHFNTGRLSHYALFNGDPTTVPEPESLLLFGLGLAALGVAQRRCR